MAGDHKCPVCQATFTRPQHVARHMRSHTGDRPYKCQHCGDQFARSDLLSRHVNKCHAGDKPPTTTAPNRRKGQQSSTRATTSKQACDQCVMATLPCDGANPCSKCIQRKSACTYVKFQRQTAPVGPGHRHSHSMESTSSTSSNISFPRPDELFLGPPPMTVPSMGPTNDMYYPTSHPQFAFNPPGGLASWENSPSHAPSLTLSSSAADSGHESSSSDVASRYRDVEMLSRGSILPLPSGYPGNPAILPNYYGNPPASGPPGDQWPIPADYPSRRDKDMQEGFAQYLPPASASQLTGPASLLHPSNFEFQGGGLYNLHTRRGSVDGYSDGGSAASGPNSATSSNAHLPLDLPQGELQQQQQQLNQQAQLDFSAYNQFGDGQRPPPSREGRFASSFGLMSLADGEGNYPGNFDNPDGSAPFFSQSALKLPPQDSTPRPFRTDEEMSQLVQATGSARDREAEMRELRDFWKQYLRTPLSGPSLGQTPKAELINNQLGGTFGDSRPTPRRGLSRVASLPSVRTPPDEKSSTMSITRLSQSHVPPTPGNGTRSGHTTDDLKSYEQAILARRTPLNLNLAPKKGRMSNASSVSPSGSPAMSQQSIQNGLPRQPGTFVEPGPNNIPSVRAGGISSLNASANDQNAQPTDARPSFKRLPSQTLENTVQKRALFSWGGNANEDVLDDSESDADGPANGKTLNHQFSQVRESSSPDRFRRLSAPTTTRRPVNSELSPASEQNRFTSYTSKMNAHHASGGGPMGLSGPGPGAQVDPMVRS